MKKKNSKNVGNSTVDIYATEINKDNFLGISKRDNGNTIIYTKRPIKGMENGKQDKQRK